MGFHRFLVDPTHGDIALERGAMLREALRQSFPWEDLAASSLRRHPYRFREEGCDLSLGRTKKRDWPG